MNEDIIRMAMEAGGTVMAVYSPDLERFAALIAAAEREACAKLIEPDEEHRRNPSWYLGGDEGVELLDGAAAKIRAKGQA